MAPEAVSDDDHVEQARAVYDASVDRYVEFASTEIGSATEAAIDQALLSVFADIVGGTKRAPVADVGCGPGRVAAFLAGRNLDVVGIDISEAMLATARRAHPNITFREGRLDHLPFDDGSLAGAVLWYSIIHTPARFLGRAFAELARVLRADGVTLVAFQLGDGKARRRADAHGTGLAMTQVAHSIGEVTACLRAAGFALYATSIREAELPHESTPQAFVIARRATRA